MRCLILMTTRSAPFFIFLLMTIGLPVESRFKSAAAHAESLGPDPVVDILEPGILAALDQPGRFSFATVIGAEAEERRSLAKRSGSSAYAKLNTIRLDDLAEGGNAAYDSLRSTLSNDVEDLKKTSGEKMAYSSEQAEVLAPAGNVARHFDPFWLTSTSAALPLVAVVNRIDKRDFFPGTCGEVRFIYRLAYYKPEQTRKRDGSAGVIESRSTLPFFLNVVYDRPEEADGTCQNTAQAWMTAPRNQGVKAMVDWALGHPLLKSGLRFKQIELNLQILRFPAGQKIDFGGQAIYLFRIFQWRPDGVFAPIPLENTPNVSEIQRSKTLRADLLRQISSGLQKLDAGIFVLENTDGKLLASRALSFSTGGRARLANKPFTAIFGTDPAELKLLDLKSLSFLKSEKGVVERLNNLSCMGCHQSGGTAGFHMLGLTGTLNSAFNQVILPFSPHVYAERSRRAAYTQLVASGQSPNVFRPLSLMPAARWQGGRALPVFQNPKARDLCLLNSDDFSIRPTCESGTQCVATIGNLKVGAQIGECVPTQLVTPGYVCRKGPITTQPLNLLWGDLYNLAAFKDTIDVSQTIMGRGALCGHPKGGVPLGRISKPCDLDSPDGKLTFVDQLQYGDRPPKEICAMRGGPQFDECAKTKNPPECLSKAKIVRSYLDTCSVGNFCREDYICQQLPEDIARVYKTTREREEVASRVRKLGQLGIGFCVPNYFVFNMRSDGHIIPEGRLTPSAH